MNLRVSNGILYNGNVKLLQAAAPKFEPLLDEIVKANTNKEFVSEDLIYYPDSKVWATLAGRRAIFELTEESQADIVSKITKPYKPQVGKVEKPVKTTEVEVDIPHPSPQDK